MRNRLSFCTINMGSEVIINQIKPRFDLSMSRRTRKPWSSCLVSEMQHQDLSTQSAQQDKEQEQDKDLETDRKISLNNLMKSEQESNEEANVKNKNSLGQHFGEDEGIKQTMQVVVKKQGGENGVKFKVYSIYYFQKEKIFNIQHGHGE
ncbi:hypothetical protein Bca4012_036705 [Brassica carinata]